MKIKSFVRIEDLSICSFSFAPGVYIFAQRRLYTIHVSLGAISSGNHISKV